jgi:thiol-disulfide isomerase/thioredoxin
MFASVQAGSQQFTATEALSDSLRKKHKPVVLYVYTDWCNVCVLQKAALAELQQRHPNGQYVVAVNAESEDDIIFLGRKYGQNTNGTLKRHQLNTHIICDTEERTESYPQLAVFTVDMNHRICYYGYTTAEVLLTAIHQFSDIEALRLNKDQLNKY